MGKKLTQEEVITRMKELEPEYDFSKFIYINAITKSTVICDKGHKTQLRWNDIQNGHRCPYCSHTSYKYSREEVIDKMKQLEPDYNFEYFEYNGKDIKSTIICNRGHKYEASWNGFRNGSRCPHCSNNKSKPEKEIIEFIKTFYNGTIEQGNRSILSSPFSNRCLEVDIYLPKLNFAIEFNGRFYHTDDIIKQRGWNSAKEMHDYKSNECFKRNIFLLHIDEVEWINDKNSILNRIKRLIRINKRIKDV